MNSLDGKDINILIIKKRNLIISRHITIHCEGLITGGTGTASDILFRVKGNKLLVANEYYPNCMIGNIKMSNEYDHSDRQSFFILEQSLMKSSSWRQSSSNQ